MKTDIHTKPDILYLPANNKLRYRAVSYEDAMIMYKNNGIFAYKNKEDAIEISNYLYEE